MRAREDAACLAANVAMMSVMRFDRLGGLFAKMIVCLMLGLCMVKPAYAEDIADSLSNDGAGGVNSGYMIGCDIVQELIEEQPDVGPVGPSDRFENVNLDDYDVFSDVPYGHEYHDAIVYLYENHVVNGTTGGRYSPDSLISQSEVDVILSRAFGDGSTAWEPDTEPADLMYICKPLFQAAGFSFYYETSFGDMSPWYYTHFLAPYGLFPIDVDIRGSETMTRGEFANCVAYFMQYEGERDMNRVVEQLNVTVSDTYKESADVFLICASLMPENVKRLFHDNGWEFHIGFEYIREYIDNGGKLAFGLCEYVKRRVSAVYTHCVWHEFGHFYDYIHDPAWVSDDCNYDELDNLDDNEIYKASISSPAEYFAELFFSYVQYRAWGRDDMIDIMAEKAPESIAVMRQLESLGWPGRVSSPIIEAE